MAKKNVKQNVETILKNHIQARNDDKKLMLLYWRLIDGIEFGNDFADDFVRFATSPESIRRARQLIQHEGKYLPCEEVYRKRRIRELSMRKSIALTGDFA